MQNAGKANVAGLLKTNSSSAIIVANSTTAAAAAATINSATNTKKNKNASNVKQQKSGSNADDGNNQNYKRTDDEFGAWCTKALSAHVDVIDGKWIIKAVASFPPNAKHCLNRLA